MITLLQPNIEYEQKEVLKAIEITPTCFAATAGSAIAFTEVLSEALVEIDKDSIKNIKLITECIRRSYVNCRMGKVDEQILLPLGLNIQQYWQMNQAISPQVVALLLGNIRNYHHQLWVLIGGVDDHGGHLWNIENPGTKACLDSIGFLAIGSGQDHAYSTFITNQFSPSMDLSHGLAITFEAKKRSEKATGVGELTDILIIYRDGYKRLSDDEIKQLNEIYDLRIEGEKNAIKEIDRLIDQLDILPGNKKDDT